MTSEVMAAADRLLGRDISHYQGPGQGDADMRAAIIVARAWRAEHPADDEELASIQWLKGLSRDGGDLSMLCVRLVDDKIHLMAPGKVTEGIGGLLDYVSPRPATRGDLRLLCRALGIPMKEQT